MKRILLATVAFAAAGTAFAADLPRGPMYPAAQPSIYNWSGFYAGGNLGYEWGKVSNSSMNPSGDRHARRHADGCHVPHRDEQVSVS